MSNDFETQMMVHEIKGILSGLERCVKDARWDLAFDNVSELTDKTTEMKKIIDRVESKVDEYNKQKQNQEADRVLIW